MRADENPHGEGALAREKLDTNDEQTGSASIEACVGITKAGGRPESPLDRNSKRSCDGVDLARPLTAVRTNY